MKGQNYVTFPKYMRHDTENHENSPSMLRHGYSLPHDHHVDVLELHILLQLIETAPEQSGPYYCCVL